MNEWFSIAFHWILMRSLRGVENMYIRISGVVLSFLNRVRDWFWIHRVSSRVVDRVRYCGGHGTYCMISSLVRYFISVSATVTCVVRVHANLCENALPCPVGVQLTFVSRSNWLYALRLIATLFVSSRSYLLRVTSLAFKNKCYVFHRRIEVLHLN